MISETESSNSGSSLCELSFKEESGLKEGLLSLERARTCKAALFVVQREARE
jgi:hypothetical protein